MAIGIGLHCWYCEHGPCSRECLNDQTKNVQEIRAEKIKSLLEEQRFILKQNKMREVSITIVNRKGNDMSNFRLSFESIPELLEKIDKAIDETEYRKVHVTLDDTDVFTSEELNELGKNNIFY